RLQTRTTPAKNRAQRASAESQSIGPSALARRLRPDSARPKSPAPLRAWRTGPALPRCERKARECKRSSPCLTSKFELGCLAGLGPGHLRQTSQSEELIDRPMIARVFTVVGSQHPSVTLNQKLGRKPQPAPVWSQTRQPCPPRNDTPRAMKQRARNRQPHPRVEQGAKSRLCAELEVESFVRIGHHRKRQVRFVLLEFFGRGVKNYDLSHASGLDLGVATSQLVKVPVTDRTAREATQLQVDSVSWVRNAYRISEQSDERSWFEHGTDALSRARRWSSSSKSCECEQQQLPRRKRRWKHLRHAG